MKALVLGTTEYTFPDLKTGKDVNVRKVYVIFENYIAQNVDGIQPGEINIPFAIPDYVKKGAVCDFVYDTVMFNKKLYNKLVKIDYIETKESFVL